LLLEVMKQENKDKESGNDESKSVVHSVSAVFLLKLDPARPAADLLAAN
jgi:hypothetical protein